MRRIAFITERVAPDIGGVAASASRISRSIVATGAAVDVISWSRDLPGGQLIEEKNEELPENYRVFKIGRYKAWDMTMPASQGVLEWLHKRKSYDAVWGHYLFPSGFFAAWFGALKGVTSFVSARGNDVDREMFPPGDFSRLLWTLNKASVVTSVSQDLASKITTLCGREDVVVLKNAVNTDVFVPFADSPNKLKLRTSLGIRDDELVLGFCGELREKKGIQFLLRSLAELRSVRPACLLIIGEARLQQQATLQLFAAERPDDASRIIVTGHVSEQSTVCNYLQLCDLFLQPSLYEGLPNALLEAMSSGLLCIASDAGGIPEVIEHGVNGFMLPRAQLHNLTTAILEALELPEEQRAQLCASARDTILKNYSLSAERDALSLLFSESGVLV